EEQRRFLPVDEPVGRRRPREWRAAVLRDRRAAFGAGADVLRLPSPSPCALPPGGGDQGYGAKMRTGSVQPATAWVPRSATPAPPSARAKSADSTTGLATLRVSFSMRAAKFTAGPITVKSSRVSDPTLP